MIVVGIILLGVLVVLCDMGDTANELAKLKRNKYKRISLTDDLRGKQYWN